ncbi:synaptic vesicle membrane protein VAT-1 homolog [Schistocerca cancellata]|uniref:synaptic vesicle membrane protein VAT-1 homolog n=1 Tax=Schistocerca cancellata TaxID=274614 RepID=UPI0021183CE2|nr:synaptic vesicle membrane protein VAT-1 homolog [Schistocerca cancellata]
MEKSESTRLVRSVTLSGCTVQVEDAPLPVELPEDHVEVRVSHCGLNFTDNYLRLGIILNLDFHVLMGSESSGTVTRVGRRVNDVQVGQKVLCLQMQGGLFRHTIKVPRRNCYLLPEYISPKTAVGLGLNYLVAHLCLFEFGHLKTKQVIFMQSIGGGVGTAVIQLARTVPQVTILGTASFSKHANLRYLGVKRVFRHEQDYVSKIREAYPDGVDLVINSAGGADIMKCLSLLKPCGRLVTIGTNSSAKYPKTTLWGLRSTWNTKRIPSSDIIGRNHAVSGLNVGHYLENNQKKVRSILDHVFQLRAELTIRPRIHSVLDFERVGEALAQLWRRENLGKVLLVVQQDSPELRVRGGDALASVAGVGRGVAPR